MRSNPRRVFSFGVTIHGSMLRIWLLCLAAPFSFFPFDWIEPNFHVLGPGASHASQDPGLLLKCFILLATSSEANLGFDTNIEPVGKTGLPFKRAHIIPRGYSTTLAHLNPLVGGHGYSMS